MAETLEVACRTVSNGPDAEGRDALYLTYDGLLEPLGQRQVLPYLRGLARGGVRVVLLSFEKPADVSDRLRLERAERELNDLGIEWRWLLYHARPRVLSTAWDFLAGTAVALAVLRRSGARIVHARSYVPALVALVLKSLTGARVLFDMRGFWPEERVELGIFRDGGLLYRVAKFFEDRFLDRSDRVVVLTERAKEALLARPGVRPRPHHIEVIPCCVDRRAFQADPGAGTLASRFGLLDRPVLGNVGAINSRYLLREMLRFVAYLRQHRPDARFVYLTRQDPKPIYEAATLESVPADALVVASVLPDEVPRWLTLFDFGVFFLKVGYAARGSCYTKLGELLAAGVPVVTNAGVGDVDRIVTKDVGVVVPGFADEALHRAADEVHRRLPVSPEARKACRAAAARHFDMEDGCRRYLELYRGLFAETSPQTLTLAGEPER